jgi:hypothetical protein
MVKSNTPSEKQPIDIRYDAKYNMIRLNGRCYVWDETGKLSHNLVEVSLRKHEARMHRILDGMDGTLDGRQILRYCLDSLTQTRLREIDELIKAGYNCKPVLNITESCIELRIGKDVMTIMNLLC